MQDLHLRSYSLRIDTVVSKTKCVFNVVLNPKKRDFTSFSVVAHVLWNTSQWVISQMG